MATEHDPEEFIEEDEQDEIARRSIFSAGWFRALLVLTVLAIVVVVSLPYLLNWLEPTPGPPTRPQAKVSEPAAPQSPTPAAPPAETKAPAMVPAPTTPPPAAKTETPPPVTPPPAKTEEPKTAQAPTPAPGPADRPIGTAPLPAAPAPAAPPAKAAPESKAETSKAAAATKRSAAPAASGQGSFWVQVGAFAEERNAEALSRKLKGENFPVAISRISRGGGAAPAPAPAPAAPAPEPSAGNAQNQLFITGSTVDAVNAALKGKGTGQPVKGGIVVNPAYDLETAMSLSSSLKKEGFKVVIRRAKASPAPAAAAAAPSSASGGTTFHVVRVGGYPDRAKAQQARAELEAKGIPGFLAQGAAR